MSSEGLGTHVTILSDEHDVLSVLGVNSGQLASWLESLGCTTTAVLQLSVIQDDAHLSGRERDVVALIGAGLRNAEISERLFLSINTIKSYVRSAYQKMGVENRSGAVRWAIRHGLAQAENDADQLPVVEGRRLRPARTRRRYVG